MALPLLTSLLSLSSIASAVPLGSSNAEPCAQVAAVSDKFVDAEIAYNCLKSIPIKFDVAEELVKSLVPYVQFQSTVKSIENPPAEYAAKVQAPFSILGSLDTILANVQNKVYTSEYDFGLDIWKVFQGAHDGHFMWLPDSVFGVLYFDRPFPLVSLSSDGEEVPAVFSYKDVLDAAKDSSFKPSAVVQIDGQDVEQFLNGFSQNGISHDPDALWNDMFYDLSQIAQGDSGAATGGFTGGGFSGFVYPGPETTITFENGTETKIRNRARKMNDFTGITSGEDVYKKFLTPTEETSSKVKAALLNPTVEDKSNTVANKLIGYPEPVIQDSTHTVNGFFLDGAEHSDVAVLALTSFEPDLNEGQQVLESFISKAKAAGKTKLIIDLSSNGGGYILFGYELFKQLFPQIEPYGGSRYRMSETFTEISKLFNNATSQYHRSSTDPDEIQSMEVSGYSISQDLDVNEQPFTSWDEKYGPFTHQNDKFSAITRANLSDAWAFGDYTVTGYGKRSNFTQPFAAEDILLLYNGDCASTCTIFSELMRQQAKVKTVAFGGRPSDNLMQAVGQVKGAQVYKFAEILRDASLALQHAPVDQQQSLLNGVFNQFQSSLPFTRTIEGGSVNYKDGLREGDADQTPLQFYYEPADCRMYYTANMVVDASEIWKAASSSKWIAGQECAVGDYSGSPAKRSKVMKRGTKAKSQTISVKQLPADKLDALYNSLNMNTEISSFATSGGSTVSAKISH